MCVTANHVSYISKFKKKNLQKRRWWIRPVNKYRPKLGHFKKIIQIMKRNDQEQFFKYTRMRVPQSETLLNMLKAKLKSKWYMGKYSIVPEMKLLLTLFYLAHGGSVQSVAWNFLIGKSTAHKIIYQTCTAIWDILSKVYLKQPDVDDFLKIEKRYNTKYNFPHCIGALDGKHVRIVAPSKSGSQFYNYKNYFSIVLLAICDSKRKFTMVDIGAVGSLCDDAIFRQSKIGQALENGVFPIPNSSPIVGINGGVMPYYLLADAAFPLKSYIMRPYPGNCLSQQKEIFNYRLSRARISIENTFGILASRWRIYHQAISATPRTAEKIVAATVCLHNFLMESDGVLYKKVSRTEMQNAVERLDDFTSVGLGGNRTQREILKNRDKLAEYFVSAGRIPNQNVVVSRGIF